MNDPFMSKAGRIKRGSYASQADMIEVWQRFALTGNLRLGPFTHKEANALKTRIYAHRLRLQKAAYDDDELAQELFATAQDAYLSLEQGENLPQAYWLNLTVSPLKRALDRLKKEEEE